MEQKVPEERKRRLDQMFEALSVIADDTHVYLCDMYYDYSRWCTHLVEEFGMPSEYMFDAGGLWEEKVHPEDRRIYRTALDSIFQGRNNVFDIQYRARRKDGLYDVITGRGTVILDDAGNPEYFAGAIRNHSEHRHADSLTGLQNLHGFFMDIRSYIHNKTPRRISMLGIGNLTHINEIYGYQVGNTVLQKFGRYLVESVGDDMIAYRLDGSKFGVISATVSEELAIEYYEKIRSHFREGIRINDSVISLELNCGTFFMDEYKTDDQTVYSCLNFAYEESKTIRHGGLVEFSNTLIDESKQQMEKFYAIRNSVFNNFEGFYLLYQPIIDAETEKLVGAEALLRWKSDKYGVVGPDDFIPFLERDPIFPRLGEWILETALYGAKRMISKIDDFVININLSYSQLEKEDFVETVERILEKTHFLPNRLCLEVTERCRLMDINLLRDVIIALRSRGVRVALDDFGTGFSSVGIMKNVPFDTVKVDRTFVMHIEDSELEEKLVKNFKDVAEIFDTKICVEGVETSNMRDILLKYGVNSFQGYYYSKPIELDKLVAHADKDSKFTL